MKTMIKLSFGLLLVLFFAGCTKNFEKINENPNQPAEVTTPTLLTAAMLGFGNDFYDEWWGGRQSMLWSEYWVQRNYTSEDRYGIRQNINNQYFRLIYHDVQNLIELIRLNEDPITKIKAAKSGDNNNQIAVATILKVWAMQIMADTYGEIPYFDAFKGREEPTPKYDKLSDIYASFKTELKTAVDMIDESKDGFLSGDVVYGGDMTKWKKFGNSLRLRVANRMSARDNGASAQAIVAEVGEDGFMTSNSDNAVFAYIGTSPNYSPLYAAFWDASRNDFYAAKPFVNILKGVDDTLNNKINPFHGLLDPRLSIYTKPKKGKTNYLGIPYGMPDAPTQLYYSQNIRPGYGGSPFAYSTETAPVILNAKYPIVYMEYAEVEFILSELNNWDQTHYINGVKASIEHWRDLAISLEQWDVTKVNHFDSLYQAYMAGLPPASKETVMTQKYLALYDQGYEAWAEIRRTGEPQMLLRPGEITSVDADGAPIRFEPLNGLTTIPNRLTFPQQEFTVNHSSVTAAAASLAGGDEMSTLIWWEPGYTGTK